MLRFLYVILFSFFSVTAHSQDISGIWWGNFDREDLSANTRGIKLELQVKNDTVVTGSLTQVSHSNIFHQYSISGYRRGNIVYFHEDAGIATNGGGYRKLRDYNLQLVSANGKDALEGSSKNYSVGIMTMPKVAVWFEKETTDTLKKTTEPPLAKNERGETVIDAKKLLLKLPEPVKRAAPVVQEAPPVIASRPVPKKPVHQQISVAARKVKAAKIRTLIPDNNRDAPTVIADRPTTKKVIITEIATAVLKANHNTIIIAEADKLREEPRVEVTIPRPLKPSIQQIAIAAVQQANMLKVILPQADKPRDAPQIEVTIPNLLKPVIRERPLITIPTADVLKIILPEADKPRDIPQAEVIIPKPLKLSKQGITMASAQKVNALNIILPAADKPRDAPEIEVIPPKPLRLSKQSISITFAQKASALSIILPEEDKPRDAPLVEVNIPKPLKLTQQGITIVSAQKANAVNIILPDADKPRDAPEIVVTLPKLLKYTNQGSRTVFAEKANAIRMIMPVPDQRRKEVPMSVTTANPTTIKTPDITSTSLNLKQVTAETPVITIAPDTNKRPPKILKTIEVRPGMPVKIEITDNARIDNDMISLYINDLKVLDKKLLTYEPVIYNITAIEKVTEIAMYAESLGSMPPCTATMKVTADNVTHTVDMSSDFKINGTVRIILKK